MGKIKELKAALLFIAVAFRLGRIESPQLTTRELKDFTRIYPRVPVSQVGVT